MMDSAEIDAILDNDEVKKYSLYRLYYSASRSRSELAVAKEELRKLKAKLARQSLDLARTEASVRAALLAVPEAKRQVRNQFSYRLGKTITRIRSLLDLIRLPWALAKERKVYLAEQTSLDKILLPAPNFRSGESYLADKTPRYANVASGRGAEIKVAGRVIFSGGDPDQSVHLRVKDIDAAPGADEIVPIVVKGGEFNIAFFGREGGTAVMFFASGEYPAIVSVRSVKVSEAR